MRSNDWQATVLYSMEEAEAFRDEWNHLAFAADPESPFFLYEWFICWYAAYIPPEKVRIVMLKDDIGRLRAVLPGFITTLRKGFLTLRCFSFASNAYSLCGGVIACSEDHDAIKRILICTVKVLRPSPHMVILPLIPEDSGTEYVIKNSSLTSFIKRLEHADEAIGFSIEDGWSSYLSGRPAKIRKRINNSFARSRKIGCLSFEEFCSSEHSEDVLHRLRRLDAKTWQGKQGSGLFSTPENERFYCELLRFKYSNLFVKLYFAVLENQDVAYHLTVGSGAARFVLKSGYHKEFGYCRPGVLTKKHVGEMSGSEGLRYVGLGVGVTDEKKRWETDRKRMENWWLINKRTLKGFAFAFVADVYDWGRS